MPVLTSYSDKRVLIVDDMPDMRTSLRSQISSLAIDKVGMAGSVKEALEQIGANKFDIILCDYYLGSATDGQQFLDYLRTKNLISRATLFIMVTAETGFEKVVKVAECMPDDYLLKPFTAESLRIRFERLLEKKDRLAKVDKLQDQGSWPEVISACDEIILAKDKYLIDAMRIKGNAMILSNQFGAAADFYNSAIALRPMPWAQLGLAKALRGIGNVEQAKNALGELISDNPNFLAAYDLLGHIHVDEGKHEAALRVLDSACKVSPNSLARQRAIAGVAEASGDYARVEMAMSSVLKQTRNSPLNESIDHAKLINALTELGQTEKAITLIKEAKIRFKEAGDVALLCATEAVTQQKAGNPELARDAMNRAMQARAGNLGQATSLAIAKACFAIGKQQEAMSILKEVIQNDPDSPIIQGKISTLLKDHGGHEKAQELIGSSLRQIIKLNNEAVARANSGEYEVASKMLTEAAARLPDNLQIVSNAAYSLLIDVFMNGMDATKMKQALILQQAVIRKKSDHPKLAELAAIMEKIKQKYSLAESA